MCVFVHQGELQLDKKMWLLCGLQAKFHAITVLFSNISCYARIPCCVRVCVRVHVHKYIMHMYCEIQINRMTVIDESVEV